jgi:hypothetical protein
MCVLCDRRREVAELLNREQKARLLASLRSQLRDVLEVVPPGQPATCVRHDDSLFAAPGVNLRESAGETSGERSRS